MRLRSFTPVLAVTVATAMLPLACGEDDRPSPGDDGASGSGAQSGGNAATGGGPGGEGGATGGNVTTGGTGGSATGGNVTGGNSTGGRAGNSTGGRAGNSTGGAGETSGGEGGASGASDGGEGGEGGEGWYDESLERAKRICKKTEALGCEEHSHCIENYRWGFARWPNCQEENERLMICFDTQTTIEDFGCWGGVPMPTGEVHCREELEPFEYECF